ncbi:MAG: hypothetical protein EA391_10975 [Balneolaceae bacterium]|nr:MAG: hypothetical protein EA391_10975 [Balneolaceae bacterium]
MLITNSNNVVFNESKQISTVYYDASDFKLIGKLSGADGYSRLPAEAEKEVREPVWNLSQHTAGLSVRFTSNSTSIKLRWTLKSNPYRSNMNPIASKGFDVYSFNNGKWQFMGEARPQNSIENEATIIHGMEQTEREYLLNFPLYDGVISVEIGIDQNAYIEKPARHIIYTTNPIVFYGTSITQGASASRPGLTYPARIQRALNKEVINLGFSGNCKFEKEVARYFMESNPSIIILDCTPNSPPATIRNNLPVLIEFIRSENDTVPIIFVESIMRDDTYFKKNVGSAFGTMNYINEQNQALKEIYVSSSNNIEQLYYISSEDLIGSDNEATVDGTHFNDVGHFRAYQQFKFKIERIISR